MNNNPESNVLPLAFEQATYVALYADFGSGDMELVMAACNMGEGVLLTKVCKLMLENAGLKCQVIPVEDFDHLVEVLGQEAETHADVPADDNRRGASGASTPQ